MRLNKLQQTAVSALEDIKARDIKVLDVRKLTSFYDTLDHRQRRFRTGRSRRSRTTCATSSRKPAPTIIGVEGEETGEWVLVDCGDIVVHVMQPAVRAYYNLEELWDARRRARAQPARGGTRPLAVPAVAP